MSEAMFLLVAVVVIGLLFDFTNGFHDAANVIATVIATEALTYRTAVVMAASMNLFGAFVATRVASTIEKGLVTDVTQVMIISALLGAVAWNIFTWWIAMPSSSSHAVVGGLVGASIGHDGFKSVIWAGVIDKVAVPMVVCPVLGLAVGFALMKIVDLWKNPRSSKKRETLFRRLQIASAFVMAFAHGSNDAQKTMGIITMALLAAGMTKSTAIPEWVIVACALAMALGTLTGGKRIIHTTGSRITQLNTASGFAAQTSAAGVIFGASFMGDPVSTTHIVVGSITGAGAASPRAKTHWAVVRTIVSAWVFTLPGAALVALLCQLFLLKIGF